MDDDTVKSARESDAKDNHTVKKDPE